MRGFADVRGFADETARQIAVILARTVAGAVRVQVHASAEES
ncbi:hypothetical protein [Actinomadura fibrosa]|uniref:Uncharacterized protein n=1 Tax=Actinomadura fibrosa TaxID=111802 RepID=A0ABW2XVD6_9ACTN|nr:hypothetical protein [Actinomadura fibrosa]